MKMLFLTITTHLLNKEISEIHLTMFLLQFLKNKSKRFIAALKNGQNVLVFINNILALDCKFVQVLMP